MMNRLPSAWPATLLLALVACHSPPLTQRRLENGTRVLDVAAHPDDEDGSLLLWYSKVPGAQVSVLYTTRGEGGQNNIGPELYRELGVIREDEIAAACAVYGADPYFLGMDDFGFSKRAEEAFERWGGEEFVVERLVYFLRRLRPHLVYTNHTPDQGHGHHRATSIALREAVQAAADPTRFPAHIEEQGLHPWQVEGLFERLSRRREAPVKPHPDALQEFDYADDEVHGQSVAAAAWEGFVRHESQGPWPAFDPDRVHAGRYHLIWTPNGSLDIDALPEHRRKLAMFEDGLIAEKELWDLWDDPASAAFDDVGPLRRALAESVGLTPILALDRPVLGRGEELVIPAVVPLRAGFGADDLTVTLAGPAVLLGYEPMPLAELEGTSLARDAVRRGGGVALRLRLQVDGQAPYTLPRHEEHYGYEDLSQRFPLQLEFTLQHAGRAPLRIGTSVPIDIVPELIAELTPAVVPVLRSRAERGTEATVTLWCPRVPRPTTLTLRALDGVELLADEGGEPIESLPVDWPDQAERIEVPVWLRPRPGRPSSQELSIALQVGPAQATGTLRVLDVEVPADLRVAFVPAQDRSLIAALRTLGIAHQVVQPDELSSTDLSTFTNVILDVRLLGQSEVARAAGPQLRSFVENGGNLLTLYHKSFEWNPYQESGLTPAPYPLTLTSSRVCEEESEVKFLLPDHPVLCFPHALGQADFAGWVQERGLYFPEKTYDARYAEILRCHDRDEEPLSGGLLVATSGAGTFQYCAYALHRQLRAGHGGGFRLFVNILALKGVAP